MSKAWTFIGGMLVGVASVFAAAAVAMELEVNKSTESNDFSEKIH